MPPGTEDPWLRVLGPDFPPTAILQTESLRAGGLPSSWYLLALRMELAMQSMDTHSSRSWEFFPVQGLDKPVLLLPLPPTPASALLIPPFQDPHPLVPKAGSLGPAARRESSFPRVH